jgi:photosystem II stability/assembly factor-like uncharacterized protein
MRVVRGAAMNVLLALAVAADCLLVVAAIHHTRSGSTSIQAAADVGLDLGVPTTEPSSPSATNDAAVEPVSGAPSPASGIAPSLLSASSAIDGWRAEPGCGRAPHLAATTDGGKTWHRLKSPAAHILRIDMTGAAAGWLVGADSTCTPSFFSTADGGATWAPSAGLGQAWVVIGNRVRVPDGAIGSPCGKGATAESITAASVTAALLVCSSRLLETTDGGVTWKPVAAYPDGGVAAAAALVPGSAGRGVALLTGATGCAGLSVLRTANTGKRWQAGPCLTALQAPAAVSLAVDGSGYALAGNASAETTNAGTSWS